MFRVRPFAEHGLPGDDGSRGFEGDVYKIRMTTFDFMCQSYRSLGLTRSEASNIIVYPSHSWETESLVSYCTW